MNPRFLFLRLGPGSNEGCRPLPSVAILSRIGFDAIVIYDSLLHEVPPLPVRGATPASPSASNSMMPGTALAPSQIDGIAPLRTTDDDDERTPLARVTASGPVLGQPPGMTSKVISSITEGKCKAVLRSGEAIDPH